MLPDRPNWQLYFTEGQKAIMVCTRCQKSTVAIGDNIHDLPVHKIMPQYYILWIIPPQCGAELPLTLYVHFLGFTIQFHKNRVTSLEQLNVAEFSGE